MNLDKSKVETSQAVEVKSPWEKLLRERMDFTSVDVFSFQNVFRKLSWKIFSPHTAALTRWELRWDVQKVPACFKSIHLLVTRVWDRGHSSGGRLGRPGTFPALILVYFINLSKSALDGHLKSHPRWNIHAVFGRLNTKINGLVSLLLSKSESCKHFTSLLSWNKDNYLCTKIKFACSAFLYSIT